MTPEQILETLQSIKKVSLDEDGCLEVWQYNDKDGAYITSFEPGSFTHELLCLIEEFLKQKG